MGIFKRKNLKNIILEQDISLYLVFPYRTKKDLIWINHTAIIPHDAELIFGYRGKVLDVLPEGEHKISAVTLPECSKKFKLFKPDKYNKIPKVFQAQAYFVSKAIQTRFEFSTNRKIKFHNPREGKFWVKIDFYMDFQVENCKKFMQELLKHYSYLKFGEAEKIILDASSDCLTEEILNQNYMLSTFTDKKDELLEILKLKQEKLLKGFGVQLVDLTYKEIHISKKAGKNIKKFEKPSVWKGLESLTNDFKPDNIEKGDYYD